MPTPVRTTNEKIVQAALEILETNGVDGLTMLAVAERVGVRAPSLYKRFKGREALLVATAESSIDDLAARLEDAAPDLERLARSCRGFAHERPEAFRLMFTASAPYAALRRSSAPVLRSVGAVVGDDQALSAARLFTAWLTGFIQMELAGAFRLGGDVEEAFDYGFRHLITGLESDRRG